MEKKRFLNSLNFFSHHSSEPDTAHRDPKISIHLAQSFSPPGPPGKHSIRLHTHPEMAVTKLYQHNDPENSPQMRE